MRKDSAVQGRAGRVAISFCVCFSSACAFLPLVLSASPANAQVVLLPGETRGNIAAAGSVVQSNKPGVPLPSPNQASAGAAIGTGVAFGREDPYTQDIYVYAGDNLISPGASSARGILFVDFCVPRSGFSACDAISDPNAPSIVVSLTFDWGVVGAAQTSGALANAGLTLKASVVDTEKGAVVAFDDLLRNDLTSHGIQFSPISIEFVPIPLPNTTTVSERDPQTFSAMLLKRGRIYRFQLSAAATADGNGWVSAYVSGRDRAWLRNVSIAVDQDPSGDLFGQLKQLQDAVSALQGQFGNLVTRIDTLEADLRESIAALNQANADRVKRNHRDESSEWDHSRRR